MVESSFREVLKKSIWRDASVESHAEAETTKLVEQDIK